jgi:G3E family GTPase
MPAHYIMIGGFLGAGKSTSILQFAKYLHGQGKKVGLITNDQGASLVDTAVVNAHGFPVEEIAGGCFCCRFNSLRDAADKLTADACPDIFLAEPVGSCTDLIATVSYPLRRMYADQYRVAPLSVLVDPVRAMRILGVETGSNFSEKVVYVYRKQLEEADNIVINKVDTLTEERLDALKAALRREFPDTRIFAISAREGTGLGEWMKATMDEEPSSGPAMDVDYEVYAEGEALLGWLNAALTLEADDEVDGNQLLLDLASSIQDKLGANGREIAHLKMTLAPDDGSGELAVVNLTRTDSKPETAQTLLDELQTGELIVNLRAEAEAGELAGALEQSLQELSTSALRLKQEHLEFFAPGKPEPEVRLASI